jgi:glycosidase/archaellum component FlaG (FlaF/FlaG flagellin family)
LLPRAGCRAFGFSLLLAAGIFSARGETVLQLFNVNWADMTKKMPELAEAGYDALWIPPPAKGSSVYSIGYDLFDPYDLGDLNQSGTTATHWGTKAQLQELVRTAHRFGIRVYFDNVMNHRAFTVPGYDANTPTNFYPGLQPKDFHLQTSGNFFRNWPSVQDYNNQFDVQYQSLGGLIDLATEPGSVNGNFGASSGSTTTKPNFIRHPGQNQFYMDTTKPMIDGSPWRPFNGNNGTIVAEDVNSYTIRAAIYTLDQTKCDGFRLDAVKHIPSAFFGSDAGDSTFSSETTFSGYTGAIQAMYDYVHGYGTNVLGNGYNESDGNRNSLFDTEATRNDAMIFGEHLGQPPTYDEYLRRGLRLLNSPLRDQMNSALNGSASLAGMDSRDYKPYDTAFSAAQSVMFAQSHDASGSYAAHRELQNAYYFMHEGMAVIYSDGYNFSGAPNYFPSIAYANYLGEYSDNQMPDICYLHNQLARGGTWGRWSDYNVVAFERYDYREGSAPKDQDVCLFVMNDKTSFPGDVMFIDNIGDVLPNASLPPGANGTYQGLCVQFPPGSVLSQLATSTPGYDRTFKKVTVRAATNSLVAAQNSGGSIVYVGSQVIPANGGAIEILIPSGGWVMYGYQWPEASRANVSTNAIVFQQGGSEVPHLTITRKDGVNGDTNTYNPLFPFKMRGSVDPYGNVIGGVHVSNLTYAIDIPVVTNAAFDILARGDASCVNTLIKLDGGIDLNSQMGLGPTTYNGTAPTNFPDLRDNKPGYATDVFSGYEQTAFQFRNGPEKFAAKNTLSNNIVSLGAETYYYTVGGTNLIIPGAGTGQNVGQTAAFVYHDPADATTATNNSHSTQRVPFAPASGQPADIYVKIGYANYINTCFIYYTTDGTNPEGAFGTGKGTTKVVQALYLAADNPTAAIDWWKVTIPGQTTGTQVRYKVGTFYGGSGGSVYAGANALPVPYSETTGAKLYGLSQFAITNFNPGTAVVWQHNDLNTNSTATGLSSGFHIVRARTFLPRTNQSSSYNTFLQTFYYDGALPTGAIVFPTNNATIGQTTYTVVVRADSTVTGVDINFQDSDPNNDDSVTGKPNGNGTNVFVAANSVSPDATISASYPNYPQEYRFVYTNIPTSGTAKIIVRLKEFATAVYPNRVTLLTNTVNTLAPAQIVSIASPGTNGTVLTYSSNLVYLVQACFSGSLTANRTNFNLFINGVLQPPANYFFQPVGGNNAWCPGFRTIQYNWNNPPLGTNSIQVIYTNAVTPISDTRTLIVAPPLRISGLDNNNQLVVWDSAPGVNYQVLATTNLLVPFAPISDPISGTGSSTVFYDPNPASQKFYEVLQLP